MSKVFDFNAPQYIDFTNLDDPKADSFFDITGQELQNKNLILKSPTKLKNDLTSLKSNLENTQPCSNDIDDLSNCNKNPPILRKILNEIVNNQVPADCENSMPFETKDFNNENDIIQNFEKLQLSSTKKIKTKGHFKIIEGLESSGKKSHHMITRLDVLNKRTDILPISFETNNENLQPFSIQSSSSNNQGNFNISNTHTLNSTTQKLVKMKRKASPSTTPRKFISLAEQVEHFYKDTPERFRFKPNKIEAEKIFMKKPIPCVPKTPQLATKFRQRKVNFPDKKQREEIELQEIKKHQIKALPLNQKIFMSPSLNLKAPIFKKPATIPQPFLLTESKKKELPQEPVFQFKAQPIPSAILQRPVGIPPKKILSPTLPNTPQIRIPKRYRVEVKQQEKSLSNDSLCPPKNTKVEPFSFEKRMKETLQKKEEYIKKVIEEEKKTFNSFKAQPMPNFKNKNDHSAKEKTPFKTVPQPFNLTSNKMPKSLIESEKKTAEFTPFKAKPASVIYQKPFVPKFEKHEIGLPKDLHLKTEKRAVARLKFDEKVKEKEEEHALILKRQLEEEEKIEKERALEERKKAEFKAKPMPRYKPFEIHASDPDKLTLPQTPKFSTKTRGEKKIE